METISTFSGRRVRVASIQLDFQPSASLDYPYIEEPALLADGEQGLTSLPPSLPQFGNINLLRQEIAREHEAFVQDRLIVLLHELEKFQVDVAVFPEYCIPASALIALKKIAPSYCVVAASHTVTRNTLKVYPEIGLDVSEEDVGRSICPIWMPSGKWARVDKLSKSRWEGALKPGDRWQVISTTNRAGEPINFAVLLCVDLINEGDTNVQRLVPRDLWNQIDLCVVPSYSPSIRDFEHRARAIAERAGRPVVYSNVAAAGGTRVFCLFGAVEGAVEKHGTKPLAPKDEAVVLVDLKVGGYAQYQPQPSPLPVPASSELLAILPLLDSDKFARFIELYRRSLTLDTDSEIRSTIDAEQAELLRLGGHPESSETLKAKIFELLGGINWRNGAWLCARLACIPISPGLARLGDKRFVLLYKAQSTLAALVNDPALKGIALDDVTSVLDAYRRALDALRSTVDPAVSKAFDPADLTIKTVTPSRSGAEFTSVFVMRLKSARVHREGLEKQIRMISTLAYKENSNLALTLRYVSLPNPGGNLKDLQIEIIGAAKSEDRGDSRRIADNFRRDLVNLMQVTLRGAYRFQLLEDVPEAGGLASPFPAKYVAELSRRVQFGTPPYADKSHFPRIHHVSASSTMSRIMDSLQAQPSACMLSVHLHPAIISGPEESFFDTYRRVSEITHHGGEGAMFFLGTERNPALRTSDAVTMQRMLGDREGLHPSFIVRVFVISEAPIPRLLLNTIGYDLWGNDTYDIEMPTLDSQQFKEITDAIQSSWAEQISKAPNLPNGLERVPYLFDPYESSRLFRLPLEGSSAAVGTLFSVIPAPAAALPEEGIEVGYGFHSGAQQQIVVRLAEGERAKHTYIVGKTGTGKSTLLRRMIEQDIERGKGVCVIDPHGDLIEMVLKRIPENRIDDVILLDPSVTEWPFGLNLLEFDPANPHHRDFVVQETIAITRKLFYFEHTGPVFEHNLRHLVLTMLDESMAGEGTLVEVPRPLYDRSFRDAIVPRLMDEFARDYWKQYDQLGSGTTSDQLFWIVSKFDSFITDRIMRNIIGQSKSTINIPEIMNNQKILLVKLPSALIGEINAALLGMIILSKLRWAGMARASLPPEERRPFYVYVDEFQNFAASGFESILAEARKYGVSLILAHQHIGQLSAFNVSTGAPEDKTAQAIFGNAATMIAFRLGVRDAKFMAEEMGLPVEPQDFENLKNYYAIAKTLIDGDVYPPFTIRTSQGPAADRSDIAERIRTRSQDVVGRPRADVERALRERIERMKTSPKTAKS